MKRPAPVRLPLCRRAREARKLRLLVRAIDRSLSGLAGRLTWTPRHPSGAYGWAAPGGDA